MKKALMMSIAALAFVAAPAMANTKDIDAKVNEKFSKLDTNKDGMISQTESDAGGEQKFAEADTDHNGNLSKAELKAHIEAEKAAKAE